MPSSVSLQSIPKEIRRLTNLNDQTGAVRGSGLFVRWSEGEETVFSSETLRRHCPCASCREARGDGAHSAPLTNRPSALRVLTATVDEETNLEKVWAVGNYAFGIRFADRHDSGIYSYEFLRNLTNSADGSKESS